MVNVTKNLCTNSIGGHMEPNDHMELNYTQGMIIGRLQQIILNSSTEKMPCAKCKVSA